MGKITAIRAGKGRRKRVSIFLEGKFGLSLETEVAVREGLKVGQELSEKQIESLTGTDQLHRCFNAATHLLSFRPRSEAELTERLYRRGFNGDSISVVITKLKDQKLVDDRSFAQFWKTNRQTFKPRSRWLTKLELRRKGVAEGIVDEVVNTIDDEEGAYCAAMEKMSHLQGADYQSFRRRLGDYLRRRGFSYEVIKQTVERTWKEHGVRLDSSSPGE